MSEFRKKFNALSFTATMAFNALAAGPAINDHVDAEFQQGANTANTYSQPKSSAEQMLNQHYSSEEIASRLEGVTSRREFFYFLNDLKKSPNYENISANIDNPESLKSVLEYTGASPLLAIPLLMRSEFTNSYPNLNLQTMDVLLSAGADVSVLDEAVLKRTDGRVHIYDLVDKNVQRVMNTPYIQNNAQIQTYGYQGNLPQAFLDDIADDLELGKKLRSALNAAPINSLEDIAPLNAAYNNNPSADELKDTISRLSASSYKQSLLTRARYANEPFDVAAKLNKSYGEDGYDTNKPIEYEFDGIKLGTQNKDYTLIVTERQSSIHSDTTHRYAESLAVRISPDSEADNDVLFAGNINSFSEGEYLTPLVDMGKEHIILSKSYAPNTDYVYSDTDFISESSISKLLNYNFHEQNGTLQFLAAGNDFNDSTFNAQTRSETIESTKYAGINSEAEAHAHNSVIVGAAHIQNGTTYMSSYSSMGADFLMETPDFYGAKINGTSFSTPIAAEYYHQIAETYGDTLTHDEIMYAALYSTDTNIYNINFHDIDADKIEMPDPYSKEVALKILSAVNEKDYEREVIETFNKTVFRTNDAGIPFHERAGAGYLKVNSWIQNLDEMKALKAHIEHVPEELSQKLEIAHSKDQSYEGTDNFNHRYVITASEDMTLEKQTIYTDQVGLNSLRITSPSGMQVDFVGTSTGYVSTRGFSGEDIKAGQQIIIESTEELGEFAEYTLRGYEDGNVMQAFRDHKLATNGLQPNSVYEGDKLSTDPAASLKLLSIRDIQDNLSDKMNQEIRSPVLTAGP